MMIKRTSITSPKTVTTALSMVPLENDSKDQQLERLDLLELEKASTSSSAWELPILKRDEGSNHLVRTVIDDLQQAQESGSVSQTSEAWNALGLIRLHTRRNPAGALACHEMALRLILNVDDTMKEATTLSDIGLCYERLGQPKDAVKAYQRAMDLMKGASKDHPQKMSLERTMARLCRK